MTIDEWLNKASKQISRLDAELILQHYLEVEDRSYLVSHGYIELMDTEELDSRLARRADKEPLAYILGYKEFYGRRFTVTPDVLIPRPETETIIDIVNEIKPTHVLEVGTGSGCISITIDLERQKWNRKWPKQPQGGGCALPIMPTTTAVDISKKALAVAQINATHYGVYTNFIQSDLLENIDYVGEGTLVIANLPYVDKKWEWLDKKALSYEPAEALYAKNHGLMLIFRLIRQCEGAGGLILEADPSQHDAIERYAREHGHWHL